ncbi:SAM-dependent methyltransferase [Streptomyces syringium]|uniref:SAM-dependent methyltransferase n=1 Tax=Streptomyces syringium TaxID=76729 RepID=UPI003413004C
MEAVSRTALWTAAARAIESDREDRLFVDPYARFLAGSAGFRLVQHYGSQRAVEYMAIRTAHLDGVSVRAVTDLGIKQIVLVAAGMDTRAYRLSWPSDTVIFELDRPELLEMKREILADNGASSSVAHISVSVDLAGPWATSLITAGFDAQLPTLWIMEGLLFYLPEGVARRLLRTTADLSAPDSRISGDLMGRGVLTDPASRALLAALALDGAPWIFGTDEPEQLLAECGWCAEDVLQPGEDRSGRWPYAVVSPQVLGIARRYFFTATRTSADRSAHCG